MQSSTSAAAAGCSAMWSFYMYCFVRRNPFCIGWYANAFREHQRSSKELKNLLKHFQIGGNQKWQWMLNKFENQPLEGFAFIMRGKPRNSKYLWDFHCCRFVSLLSRSRWVDGDVFNVFALTVTCVRASVLHEQQHSKHKQIHLKELNILLDFHVSSLALFENESEFVRRYKRPRRSVSLYQSIFWISARHTVLIFFDGFCFV